MREICAIYARTSTDRQRERHTIDSQLRILPEYAEKRGWKIFNIYVDDGISGETIEERPKFSRLLEDAEQGCFNVVLVIDLDRIVRSKSSLQGALIYDLFRENNIKLATPNELIDLSNEDQDLLAGIKREMAKWEKRKILGRMQRGRIEALKQGRFVGSRIAYGYRWNKEKQEFEIEPEEAEFVRLIFNLCIEENWGSVTIADYLNKKNVPTRSARLYPDKLARYEAALKRGEQIKKPKPPHKWAPIVIDQILKNTIQYGEFINNRRQGRIDETIRPREEWIIIKVPAHNTRQNLI